MNTKSLIKQRYPSLQADKIKPLKPMSKEEWYKRVEEIKRKEQLKENFKELGFGVDLNE